MALLRPLRLLFKSQGATRLPTGRISRPLTPRGAQSCVLVQRRERSSQSGEGLDQNVVTSPHPLLDIPSDISLTHHILSQFPKHGDSVAFVNGVTGEELTYTRLHLQVTRAASALTRMGLQKGDVITIFSPNCPEFGVLYLAALAIGAAASCVNPMYTTGELEHALSHSSAKVVVSVPMLMSVVKEAVKNTPNVKHIISIGDSEGCRPFSDLMEDDGKAFPENVDLDPLSHLAALPYSSGTTGLPKGVMLTHHNVLANIEQIKGPAVMDYTPEDTLLGVLPFFHIYGQVVVMLTGLISGVKIVTMPKFDPEMFLNLTQNHKATFLHIVPPIVLFLAKHPMVSNFDLKSVHTFFSGAAPLGGATIQEMLARLGPENSAVFKQGYGLTEASPVSHVNPQEGWDHDSCGVPVHNTLAKIVDIESGTSLEVGQEGELCVKGPQIMAGYLNNPKATAETVDPEGWLHTGDIGYYDENKMFFITDRLKELIKYKGFQVAPAELESLLLTNPKVQDAAVIGVPDERAGELPRAYVVLKPGETITEDDIKDFVVGKVAPYKELSGGVEFREAIPKSLSGKILRKDLKAELKEKMSR